MKGTTMNIYTDRMRITSVILVHLLFIAGLTWLLFNSQTNLILSFMIFFVIALFIFITIKQMKVLLNKKLNYQISEAGIVDYSQDSRGLHLNWENINRIEMVADQSDFNIMITGYTEEIPFVVIVIDRFTLRWQVFSKVWKELKKYSEIYEFEIIDNRLINKQK